MSLQQREIEIYKAPNGKSELIVTLKNDTVWLSQQQIALLFESSRSNIAEHIRHIFQEEELEESSTCRNFRQVQKEGTRTVSRNIPHYNLDMILSVGYRVKSKIATRFRQWATSVLRQHLIQGYTVNTERLKLLHQTLEVISRADDLTVSGIADILKQYTCGLDLLDGYDHNNLSKPVDLPIQNKKLTYKEARTLINSMEFSAEGCIFGQEKDNSFQSAIGAIYQTFDKKDLYPGVLEKAANLLYFLVKNHPFIDGNKRIAAALFIYFLNKNGVLRNTRGQLRIGNNTLAALTLMIALSKPEEKEIMCLLTMNILKNEYEL